MIPARDTPAVGLRCRVATFLDQGPPVGDFCETWAPPQERAVRLDQWIESPPQRLALLVEAQPAPRRPAIARLFAIAAAVPLLALPLRAKAGEPPGQPAVADTEPDTESDTEPVESVDPASPPDSTSPSQAPTAPASDVAPGQPDPLALTGRTLWDGLLNRELVLDLSDGTIVVGTLINHTEGSLIVSAESYPEPFEIPKNEVRGVSEQRHDLTAAAAAPPQRPRGTGLLAGGIVLTVAGAAGMIGFGVAGGSPSYLFYFGIPAAAAIGAGIPMIVVGAKRRQDYRRKLTVAAPSVYAGRHGGGATLRLRF